MTIENSNAAGSRETPRKATRKPHQRRHRRKEKLPNADLQRKVEVDKPRAVEVPRTLLARTSGSFESETSEPNRNTAAISPINSDEDEDRKRRQHYGFGVRQMLFPSLGQAVQEDVAPADTYDGDVVEDDSDCEILTDDEDEPDIIEESSQDHDHDSEADKAEIKETSSCESPPPVPSTSPSQPPKSPDIQLQLDQQKHEGSPTAATGEGKPRRRRILSAELRVQLTPLRTMRAVLASKTNKLPQHIEAADSDSDQEDPTTQEADGSSSEESSYADDYLQSMEFREAFFEDDVDQVVDFTSLPFLPNTFLNVAPDSYDYLDPDLVKNISDQDISLFAWEHHLLVKGLLQLLAERDHIGVEGDVHDPSNIIKMGPLKKKFAQLWFVKYVEIRKGNLSYYEDTKKDGHVSHKTIHLRKRTCKCKALVKDVTSGGFAFELIVEGRPKIIWMAKSEEERQGWIRAINQAMIGETDDATDIPLDLSLYQTALDFYQSVQVSLQGVKTLREYMVAAAVLRKRSSSALRVPLQWVREQVEQAKQAEEAKQDEEREMELDAPEERVKSSITDFWKSLCNTSVSINGHFVDSNSAYSAERVVGALSRCILEFDKCEASQDPRGVAAGALEGTAYLKSLESKGLMTEVEAVSYARSILMGILRSQTRGDANAAINNLCQNEEVVLVRLESSEPLHIDVSFAGDDFSEYETKTNDVTGWFPTRTRKNRNWKERFFVVSEGVLSHYENADPRPHGLRGQLVLGVATLEVLDDNTLQIQTKDVERQILFPNRADFHKWKTVIQTAIDSQGGMDPESQTWRHKRRASLVGAGVKPLKDATEAGVKLLKGATGGGRRANKGSTGGRKKAVKGAAGGRMKVFKGATEGMKGLKGAKEAGMKSISDMIARRIRGGPYRRQQQLDLFMSSTRNIQGVIEKRAPTVQVVVELTSVFKVIPTNSNNSEEALLDVRVKLFQAFLLSGGEKGRMVRGDELVEMEFVEGEGTEDVDPECLEPPTLL